MIGTREVNTGKPTSPEFEYKDHTYKYEGVCKFKDRDGKWIDAIMYSRDGHTYVREIIDFITKFKAL